MSLVVLVIFQTGCARDEATAPQPVGPTTQVVGSSTVASGIAFWSTAGGTGIFVMAADGSERTRLTGPGAFDFDPSFSPDGRQIAFSRWLAGELQLAEILVMAADGSGVTRITNNDYPDEQPTWSPDGRQIALVSRQDNNWDIYVINADGSARTRLTDHPGRDQNPKWSPDGQKIAFWSDRDGNLDVYVMNTDGSALTRLTTDPGVDVEPTWSPDGRRIAFSSGRDGNSEIYVMGADGSAPTRLTNNPASDGTPSWSPTGRIAFTSNRDGNFEIYVMNADGSAPTRLTNHPSSDADPSWGPWLDQTPPQLTLPNDFGVSPQRWFGALAGYIGNVSATDDLDPQPDIACTPPSPSVFPIGTTQVQCTATDEAGNSSTGTFALTVRNQYQELAFDVANLEAVINNPGSAGSERVKEVLAKVQAARTEFARTPTDRLAALGHLQSATENLYLALEEGEISAFGFDVHVRRFAGNARLTADQAIAEAKARGGNAAAIADAESALAKGDEKRAARLFTDAVAQYRKACKSATDA